jgi:predicted short-subunit dehydrogenase-like oxidoreductase (DUF2520 family)
MTGSFFNATRPMLFFAGTDDDPADNQWNTQAFALSAAKRFRFVGIGLKLVINMNGTWWCVYRMAKSSKMQQ